MSIDYFQGMYKPTCDICGAELPAEFDYYDAMSVRRDAGWECKVDGRWQDICCDCQGEEE